MKKMLLAALFASALSAPALAGTCAELGRGMRFCDQSDSSGSASSSQTGSASGSQGQTTSNQNNAGSRQTTR
jgi:hypothetical protein